MYVVEDWVSNSSKFNHCIIVHTGNNEDQVNYLFLIFIYLFLYPFFLFNIFHRFWFLL